MASADMAWTMLPTNAPGWLAGWLVGWPAGRNLLVRIVCRYETKGAQQVRNDDVIVRLQCVFNTFVEAHVSPGDLMSSRRTSLGVVSVLLPLGLWCVFNRARL